MKRILFIWLMIIFVSYASAQTPDWFIKLKKLQKFPATDKDVEKLFHSPEVIYSPSKEEMESQKFLVKYIEYQLPEGVLRVKYSVGRCSEKNTDGYDLEEGVIVSYYFILEESVSISKLKLKPSKFEIDKSSDTDHLYFRDLKKGLIYTIYAEKLQSINFLVPSKYFRRCTDIFKNSR